MSTKTEDGTNNKYFSILTGLLVLGGLGYFGLVEYPKMQSEKLNTAFSNTLAQKLSSATSLTDSLNSLNSMATMMSMPPYDKISPQSKSFVSNTIQKLEDRSKTIKKIEQQKKEEEKRKAQEREILLQLEETAWSRAVSENTIQSYREYQQSYPNGEHIDQASNRIDFFEKSPIEFIEESPVGGTRQAIAEVIRDVVEADDIETYVNVAGKHIVDACSTNFAESIKKRSRYIDHRILSNGQLEIAMTVYWIKKATLRDCELEIKGKLTLNQNGCNPSWLYEETILGQSCRFGAGCRWIADSYFPKCLK